MRSHSLPRGSVPLLAFLAASLLVFRTSLQAWLNLAMASDPYTHLVAVPAIALGLLIRQRRALFLDPRSGSAAALAMAAAGLGLYAAGRLLPIGSGSALSLAILGILVVWVAAFWFCYGTPAFEAARFPLAFLVLMVPVPPLLMDRIILVLQTASAELTYRFFLLAGVPMFRNGTRFELPGIGIEVARECSSIHSGVALFLTSLLVGHFLLRSFPAKVILALAAAPIAVFTNAIRIVTIWFLATHVDPGFMYGDLHHRGGIVFSLIALSLLLACVWILRRGYHHAIRT